MLREFIKKTRKQKGISQKDLAAGIGVRPATISEFEAGKYALGSDKIEKIFEILNISLS